MKNFSYVSADCVGGALSAIARTPGAKFLAGGTNLVDLMREGIEQPDAVVDITRVSTDIEELEGGGLRIGAGVKNTAVAEHVAVRERFPVLSQAILFGASGQIRNMATVGGNLMQRTRCYYFYDDAARCNKRQPGAGCDAVDGFNRIHAVLGASEHCVATHPSDMCVALAALDATVHVQGPRGARRIPILDFHRLPGDTPNIDTNLQPDQLITSVELAASPLAANSLYRKVRDRSSYAFALVSVAAALQVEGGLVGQARLALGGVAHKPWRATEAERVLQGAAATTTTFREAADAELQHAVALRDNGFKIELAKRTIVMVLERLANDGGAR
jgi:xanthine dehydrogenase YagS FAD-binding subunit